MKNNADSDSLDLEWAQVSVVLTSSTGMLPVGSWDTPFSSKGLDKFILTEAFLKWLMKTPSDHSEMRVREKKTI